MRLWLVLAISIVSAKASGKLPPLPGEVEVSIDESSAATLHQRALDHWKESFDPQALRGVAAKLVAAPEGIDEDLVGKLKDIRKHGAILRAAYQSLDDSHLAPRPLDRFIAVFGKLNDAIENKVPDDVRVQAERLVRLLEPEKVVKLDSVLAKFKPTTKASFDHYIDGALSHVAVSVQADELSAQGFHDVRKSLKNVLAVVHLLEDGAEETKRTHATYKHLFALNDKLGAMHDELVRKDLKGGGNYKDMKIAVPKVLRQSITDLRTRFRNIAK